MQIYAKTCKYMQALDCRSLPHDRSTKCETGWARRCRRTIDSGIQSMYWLGDRVSIYMDVPFIMKEMWYKMKQKVCSTRYVPVHTGTQPKKYILLASSTVTYLYPEVFTWYILSTYFSEKYVPSKLGFPSWFINQPSCSGPEGSTYWLEKVHTVGEKNVIGPS